MFPKKWHTLDINTANGLNSWLQEFFFQYKLIGSWYVELSFYPGTRLLKLELKSKKEGEVSFLYLLYKRGLPFTVLDLTNKPIYQFNESQGVRLNDDTILDYLDFFFSFVKGRHGYFHVINEFKDIPLSDQQGKEKLEEIKQAVRPPEFLTPEKTEIAKLKCSIAFKDTLFSSEILIEKGGIVKMQNEEAIVDEMLVNYPEQKVISTKPAFYDPYDPRRLKEFFLRSSSRSDRKVMETITAILVEESLETMGEHTLLKFTSNENQGYFPSFVDFILKNRPVVVLESSIPFIEEILVLLLQKADRFKLAWIKAAPSGDSNSLTIPHINNDSLLTIPLHAYSGIANEQHLVHVIAMTDAPVLVGCDSFSVVPKLLQQVTDLVLEIPDFTPVNIQKIFSTLLKAELPPSFELENQQWISQVLPVDFQQPCRMGYDVQESIEYIRNRVKERETLMKPDDAPDLDELHGLGEAMEIARDIIDDVHSAIQGKIKWSQVDKGMLMVGPPGTGKTTLAKAIAKSCGIRFINVSASKWSSQDSLGPHLRAIQTDFSMARRFSPCILFIDEFDSIGSRENISDRNAYYNTAVVNAVLQEIQGFDEQDPVIIIGATNFAHLIDPALRRAGRLDQVVELHYPTIDALTKIYDYYLKPYIKEKLAGKNINTAELAAISLGLTGADVEQYVRGAFRRARKQNRKIDHHDLMAEITQKPRNQVHSKRLSKEEVYRLAVHEAGHALLRILSPSNGRDIGYVSIVPRHDGKLGFVASIPKENVILTQKDYYQEVEIFLAGRAAEEVVFGKENVSNGAGGGENSDLAQVTRLAERMITKWGMGKTLEIWWSGESTAEQTREIYELIQKSYQQTIHKIYSNREKLDKIIKILIEKQEITGRELLENI